MVFEGYTPRGGLPGPSFRPGTDIFINLLYVCDTLKSKALILLCCHLNFIKGIVISKCNFPISKPEHYANLLLDYWVFDAGRNHITELSRADDVDSFQNFSKFPSSILLWMKHLQLFPSKLRKGFESARNKIKRLL